MSTTTSIDKNAVASAEDVLRARFNSEVTKYKVDIKLMAEKRHKSFDSLVEILWRKFKRASKKHDALTIATAKQSNARAGLIVEPTSVDWNDERVVRFTEWYTAACQPRVDILGREIKAKIKITDDKVFDSIQDSYMYYLAHLDLIPIAIDEDDEDAVPLETQYVKLLLSKAKRLRMDEYRRGAGKMSNGQVSKLNGTYAHIQNSYDKDGNNYIYNNSGEAPTGIKVNGVSVA